MSEHTICVKCKLFDRSMGIDNLVRDPITNQIIADNARSIWGCCGHEIPIGNCEHYEAKEVG